MKNKKRILAFFLSFMFLFFVGCDGGPLGGGDDDQQSNPISMGGTKVLSKPIDYDFEQALGGYSENFYNIFSRFVLFELYKVYENQTVYGDEEEVVLKDLDQSNGYTFGMVDNSGNNKYYFFDTLRYTIKNISYTYAQNGVLNGVKIEIDLNDSWNWSIGDNVSGKEIVFRQTSAEKELLSNSTFLFKGEGNDGDIRNVWTEIYNIGNVNIDFHEFYYGTEVEKFSLIEKVTDYFTSPFDFYGATGVNFFQDALEYATYLIVLGYNLDDEKDAPLFDFQIEYDASGHVSGMKVNGWESNPISIEVALERVKSLYKELGAYIGLTQTNREQLADFIKQIVIGDAYKNSNIFKVTHNTYTDTGTGVPTVPDKSEDVTFNRNYDKIVENIINYACTQAPIGYEFENGNRKKVTLEHPYLISQITDYQGDYFMASYDDNSDDDMFKYIRPAQYQSIVIYPDEEEFNLNLLKNKLQAIGDLSLAFEYWQDPRELIVTDKVYAPSITINIGFRYFDHEKGEFTANVETQKVVEYGKFPSYDGYDVDTYPDAYSSRVASFSDTGTGTDEEFGEIIIKTKFSRNIGNGVINPFVNPNSVGESLFYKSITINGKDRAREYYKLNDSSSYGVYGTLNEQMFVDEDGCDFIEIYFDVVKEKGISGLNYNFKVAILSFNATDDVFGD